MQNIDFERLIDNRKYFIIHNDLDGILSFLFLNQKGYRLGGIYNMNEMYLKEGITIDDCFAVDLDLSIHEVPSIGHHFTLFSGQYNYNPNNYCGITDSEQYQSLNDYMKPPRFKKKCPLPTILLLHSLTQTPLPKDPYIRGWIQYADGLYKSFENFKGNVKFWLKEFGFESIIEDLTSPKKGEILDSIRSFIQQEGHLMSGQGFSVTSNNPNPQCKLKPLEFDLLAPFLRKLNQILYQNNSIEIPDLSTAMEGHFFQFYLNDLVYEQLKQKYLNNEVISHCVVYSNVVNVTLTSPLDEKQDINLLRFRTPRSI